jgi:CRISPR/Cas system-associated endonuclease Cas1
MERYRYLVDDFVIQYCLKLQKKNFIMKNVDSSASRRGKREYLNDSLTRCFMKSLEGYFLKTVNLPRIRMGNRQELETLISEEAMLLAEHLRNEKQTWIPRIASLA